MLKESVVPVPVHNEGIVLIVATVGVPLQAFKPANSSAPISGVLTLRTSPSKSVV